jgi:uncharacterized protein (AIM24 family)
MVEHEVIGDDMQAVILRLAPGDVVRAEAGAMMFMTESIEMDAKMEGGFLGGLKRKFLSGESFFITYFRCNGAAGKVAFAGPYPGKIPPTRTMSYSISSAGTARTRGPGAAGADWKRATPNC